jgi:hypothetical protein
LTTAAVPGARSFPSHNAKAGKARLFLSDGQNGVVYIFDRAGALVSTFLGFASPRGLALDRVGSLYVADFYNSSIEAFAKGHNGTPTVLSDPSEYPESVAVDRVGNVAVTNFASTSGGSGSISFYAKGGTSPTKTIVNTAFNRLFFNAFDASGTLYLDGNPTSGSPEIGVVTGGIKKNTIEPLTISNYFQYPGGVQVTRAGLIAVEARTQSAIYTYKPPDLKAGSLGSPVYSTPSSDGLADQVTFAFDHMGSAVITADAATTVQISMPILLVAGLSRRITSSSPERSRA